MYTSAMIQRALDEDVGHGDITTEALIQSDQLGTARFLAKEQLVPAGLGVAGAVFTHLDPSVKIQQFIRDGLQADKGQVLMEVQGSFAVLLKAERTALNFLQHMSGIATLTKKYVDLTVGSKTKILDTRKTTPLFRHLDKYSVTMGGGINHRYGLYDQMMIKDNHIAALGGDIRQAVLRAREKYPRCILVVETATLTQVKEIADLSMDRVLLDNMSNDQIQQAMKILANRTPVEISGGITLDRIPSLCALEVDFISVGALTHSSKAVDISLEIDLI